MLFLGFLLEQEILNHMLSSGTNNFADLSYLFIYSIFLLPAGQSGKQLCTTISCHWLTVMWLLAKYCVQNCLDISVTRHVILWYKCMHEGFQKSFKSRKGYNVHQQRNFGKQWETSTSGAKSFHAVQLMLNAKSFISSPLSKLHIKMLLASGWICENRSCGLRILRKSVNCAFAKYCFAAKSPLNSPLLLVVQILRKFAKYCESLSFSQKICKVFAIFGGVQLRNTYFAAFLMFFSFLSTCYWTLHVWLLQKCNDCNSVELLWTWACHQVCLQNWCEIAKLLTASNMQIVM